MSLLGNRNHYADHDIANPTRRRTFGSRDYEKQKKKIIAKAEESSKLDPELRVTPENVLDVVRIALSKIPLNGRARRLGWDYDEAMSCLTLHCYENYLGQAKGQAITWLRSNFFSFLMERYGRSNVNIGETSLAESNGLSYDHSEGFEEEALEEYRSIMKSLRARLGEKEYRAFIMSTLQRKKAKDIAREMHKSIHTVYGYLKEARKKYRQVEKERNYV